MRNMFAKTFYEVAKRDPRLAVVVADISPAGPMAEFRNEFPERFVNVGVAEQTMIGLCAGKDRELGGRVWVLGGACAGGGAERLTIIVENCEGDGQGLAANVYSGADILVPSDMTREERDSTMIGLDLGRGDRSAGDD